MVGPLEAEVAHHLQVALVHILSPHNTSVSTVVVVEFKFIERVIVVVLVVVVTITIKVVVVIVADCIVKVEDHLQQHQH